MYTRRAHVMNSLIDPYSVLSFMISELMVAHSCLYGDHATYRVVIASRINRMSYTLNCLIDPYGDLDFMISELTVVYSCLY